MPTTDGVFVLDASAPAKIDGVMKQRINLMFVFTTDPFDLGGSVRAKVTPAHEDGDETKSWLLSESAKIMLPLNAPQIIKALNNGEAIYRVIGVTLDYPINVGKELPGIEALWRKISDAGQKQLIKDQFQYAGAWIEFNPTAA